MDDAERFWAAVALRKPPQPEFQHAEISVPATSRGSTVSCSCAAELFPPTDFCTCSRRTRLFAVSVRESFFICASAALTRTACCCAVRPRAPLAWRSSAIGSSRSSAGAGSLRLSCTVPADRHQGNLLPFEKIEYFGFVSAKIHSSHNLRLLY
jgi:hypothetical protein